MRTIPSLREDRDSAGSPHTISYDFLDTRQHRMVLYYDGLPHILQYGCHSKFVGGEDERSEVGLWREGKKFFIVLDGQDVRNTALHEMCLPLWKLRWKGDKLDEDARVVLKTAWNDGRAQMFDLMIYLCLPILQSLAPVQEHWQTIGDHLHCPNYSLRITSDKKSGEIMVEHTNSITENTSVYFDYSPKPTKHVGDIPGEVPQYSPYDLVDVGDNDTSSSREDMFDSPRRVRLKDGTTCYFFSGECGGEWYEVSEIRDETMNTIRAYFEIEKALQDGRCAYPGGLLRLVGVVVDHEQKDQCQAQDWGAWIAGILLPWLHGAKILRAYRDASKEQMVKWRRQILDTIKSLHELGIAVGAEDMVYADDPFSYVNDSCIIIDSNEDAYLMLTDPVFAERSYDGQSYAKYARLDLEALERVFPGCNEEDKAHARL